MRAAARENCGCWREEFEVTHAGALTGGSRELERAWGGANGDEAISCPYLGVVKFELGRPQLFGQLQFPTVARIHGRINNSVKIGKPLDLPFP